MTAFLRFCRVTIGLSATGGLAPITRALVFESSGKGNDLRIEFTVVKSIMGDPNMTHLVITNLTKESRNVLSTQGVTIQLEGGYLESDVPIQTLSLGALSRAIPSVREGPTIRTFFTAFDGVSAISEALYIKTYAGQFQVADVVRDAAQTFPGIQVGDIQVSGTLGPKGVSWAGKTSDFLDILARHYGFSWSIQNGVFQAITDNTSNTKTYTISYKTKNLHNASPIIDNELQIVKGIEIKATLDGRIIPGDQVNLVSEVNPELNGVYIVSRVTHVGDTHGLSDNWTTTIQSYKQFAF
jgi:hypothetical protein